MGSSPTDGTKLFLLKVRFRTFRYIYYYINEEFKIVKYYTVYKIINLINNKIYVGVHITDKLDDVYFGSGKNIKRAIKKYGLNNFKKEYISICKNAVDMYKMESKIVNEEFITDTNTYNIVKGGNGGFDYINTKLLTKGMRSKFGSWKDDEKRKKIWNSVPIEVRIKNARKMGLKYGGKTHGLSSVEINNRLELLKDIDMMKRGWVKKASIALNVSHAQIKRFIDKHYTGNYYRRKLPT